MTIRRSKFGTISGGSNLRRRTRDLVSSSIVRFNPEDTARIDLLGDKLTTFGDYATKVPGKELCWKVTITIATLPSIYTEEIMSIDPSGRHEDINCNVDELIYVHEGVCRQEFLNPVIAKLYLSFIDPGTTLVYAYADIQPMTYTERLKKYGPFKTNVNATDNLDIHYWYDPRLYINADYKNRPLTSSP